ncbi:MAG: phosphatase PAP2 family protein [Clostridia bacterium]|nr:phosphatase PAP2 family protein [Clostridia bacterium]
MTLFLERLALAFDFPVLEWIQSNLRCGFLDAVMPPLTRLSDAGIIWIVFTLICLAMKKHRKTGAGMAVALVLGLIICNGILKPVVARIRPYDYQLAQFGREISLLIPKETDFSFPSGHTIAAFEAAVALFLSNKKLGIPAIVLAVLTAFSRMYLYVHYPSDVIVSVVLGTAFAFAGKAIVDAVAKKRAAKKA